MNPRSSRQPERLSAMQRRGRTRATRAFWCGALAFTAALLISCHDSQDTSPDMAPAAETPAAGDGSRLNVSAAVQRNLGITFATVERRAVSQTLRVSGQFELMPTARRDYHSAVSGRVELRVRQYDPVTAGDVIATIDSPDWRDLQAALTQAEASIHTIEAGVVVAEVALQEQQQRVALLEDRVERLATAEIRRIELDNDLSQARLALPRLEAEVNAASARVEEAAAQLNARLQTASSRSGLSLAVLNAPESGEAYWMSLETIPILAVEDGIIDTLAVTNGQWIETGDELVTSIQPDQLRFRAEALLGDVTELQDGLPCRIAPPSGLGATSEEHGALNDSVNGTLIIGPTAHAEDRTVRLYVNPGVAPSWARSGVPGFLEITLDPDVQTELAIPRSAMVQDGLDFIFFRRDPREPDQVQRVLADSGAHDGRWVEIFSGVREGDQVVVDGVYQLLAASSSTIQKGGHFHNDGTFHEGDD